MIFGLIKRIKQSMEPKTMVTVKKIKTKRKTARKKVRLKKKSPLKKRKKLKSKLVSRKSRPKKPRKKKIVRVKVTKKQTYIQTAREELIGVITHFFPQISVCVLTVTSGNLKVGDTIRIIGSTTNLKQRVKSIQINHVSIQTAVKGDEVGLKVSKRVRIQDRVYKLV